jgi:hypothetical protein
VIVVPWTLEPPDPETVIADEEPDKEPRPKTARHPRRKREATRETAS